MATAEHPSVFAFTLLCSHCNTSFALKAPGIDSKQILAESCSNCHPAWTKKRTLSNKGAAATFNEMYKDFGGDLF